MKNLRIYLILIALSVILLILILISYFAQSRQKKNTSPTDDLIPTTTLILPTQYIRPTTIAPTSFTGVREEAIPPNILALSEQKQLLEKRTPVSESLFTITFDWGEDKFIVELKEPKDQSQNSFQGWLQTNYPALTSDLFILQ